MKYNNGNEIFGSRIVLIDLKIFIQNLPLEQDEDYQLRHRNQISSF